MDVDHDSDPKIVCDHGHECWFLAKRFELAESEKEQEPQPETFEYNGKIYRRATPEDSGKRGIMCDYDISEAHIQANEPYVAQGEIKYLGSNISPWQKMETRSTWKYAYVEVEQPATQSVEPPAFKVGDKVRCVKEYPYWLTEGNTYKVTHDSAGSVHRTVCVDGDNGLNGGFDADYFELAESEKEQPEYRPFGPADTEPETSPFTADYASIEQSVQSTIDRSMLIYNYLDAKRDFEAASTAYNEACQAIRDKLKDGERFVYTRYSEAYIVQRDKDGFTVDRIDMV
jgi:hypothetical protein